MSGADERLGQDDELTPGTHQATGFDPAGADGDQAQYDGRPDGSGDTAASGPG